MGDVMDVKGLLGVPDAQIDEALAGVMGWESKPGHIRLRAAVEELEQACNPIRGMVQ